MGLGIDSLVKCIWHLLALEEQQKKYLWPGKGKGKTFFLDFQNCAFKIDREMRGQTHQVG